MSHQPRAGSATRENRAFRQAIASMRQEVLESQAETQRVKDQLNCLIMLVKRAWSGDQSAAVHVANIVGVAPPTFQQESEGKELKALYKTKSVHHWAMLTVGLLNKHYRRLEEHALSLAKKRLQKRQEFLDDQLRNHQDMVQKPQTVPLQHHQHQEIKKPSFFLTSDSSSGQQKTTEESLAEHIYLPNKPRLFEVPAELDSKSKAKRPMSAHQMKKADAQRARPRSAAVKTERPLKYETTRPASAKVKTKNNTTRHTIPPRSRAKEESPADDAHFPLDLNGNDSKESRMSWKEGPISMEDSVTAELRKIEQMEEAFQKSTKLLQLKLGISDDGAI